MRLNGGCGTWYADGWVNTDVWKDETTKPDVLIDPGEPYPFLDDTFEAVYLGHVIEHIAWPLVPPFLSEIQRISKPGALVLVVGPDVFRTIKLWSAGSQPWFMVESTLEHQDVNWQPGRTDKVWLGAAHHWNCHEERVVALLQAQGFNDIEVCTDEIPNNPSGKNWTDRGIDWPVVGKHEWQFAVRMTV